MTEESLGPYRLVSLLGRGGMGEVWQAVNTSQDDRVVALKVLGTWLNGDQDFARRFRRESSLVAKLFSPHIVPIHSYGEIDGKLYLDMQLVDGADLAGLIASGPLPPHRVARIVAQVAKALDTAHRAGLVHRDVKPSNILVCDGDDHTYLIDFGIARAVDSTRISLSGAMIGTLTYMAPERFVGDGDHRSDIYALGCVLHEALTGTPAFSGSNALVLLNAHHNDPIPRPSALRPGLAPAWDAVVARALARDPDQRFQTAGQLAAAARHAAGAGAVATVAGHDGAVATGAPAPWSSSRPAPPTSRPDPPWAPAPPPDPSPARRRGRVVAMALFATLLLVGALVAGVSLANRPSTGTDPAIPTSSPTTTEPVSTVPLTDGVLSGHTGTVYAVATMQLGGHPVAVSGSEDNTLRVWDLGTREQIGTPFTGHTEAVHAVTTMQLDGRTVVVSGGYDGVRVWDPLNREQLGAPMTRADEDVEDVATAEVDGRPVIVAATGNVLRVWDAVTHEQVGTALSGHTDTVYAVATTQLDGRPVAVSGSIDKTLRVWDLTSHQQIGDAVTGFGDTVYAVAVAELDGRQVIVSGCFDDTVRVWDLASRQQLGEPITGHGTDVETVAVTQLDGRPAILSGGDDNAVRMWDLVGHAPIGSPLRGHTNWVYAVTTARVDGRLAVVSGSSDGTLRVWDAAAHAST